MGASFIPRLLAQLRDVVVTTPANGDALLYTDGVWTNGPVAAGGGAPTGAAGGVLSGTYPDPGFAADMATQAELNAHAADTTAVHGITDTSVLETASGAQAKVDAAIAALINSAPGALDTLDELAAALGDDANYAATVTTALAGKQPLDADLTAIAALTTTSFGRALLALADQAALLSAAGAAAASHAHSGADITSGTVVDARIDSAIARDTEVTSAIAALSSVYQPLDSDLTAIAALTTTSYGRAFLALADAAAGRSALGLGTLATQSGTFSGTSSGTNTGDQTLPTTLPPNGAAGGVLGGTYPNPSFAADMATQAELDAHVNDTSAAHAASSLSFSPTGTIAATDVQAAIAEVATEAGGGVPYVGTSPPASPTDGELWWDTDDAGGAAAASQASLDAHISDSSAAHAASAVAFTPAGTVAATDVQAAIAEVAAEAAAALAARERVIQLKVLDDATVVTTGDGKLIFVASDDLGGLNLVDADAYVTTVSSSGLPTVQIRNVTQAADMLTTKITIDASETTSYTAATAPVIDAANRDVATGDLIAVDVDVAGTGAKGLGVILTFA